MHASLIKAFVDASHNGWRRRNAILGLLMVLWLPVELLVGQLPAARSALGKLVLESIVDPLWVGALLHLCRADLRRKPIGLGTALRRAARSYPRLFGIRAVLEMRMILGLVAGLVPGLVMFVRYALMDVLAICEDVGPTQCRTRSRLFVEKHSLAVLAVLALGNLVPLGLGAVVDTITDAVQNQVVAVILNTSSFVVVAFLPLTLFEFYRARITPSATEPTANAATVEKPTA